jgi:hypothetical protein
MGGPERETDRTVVKTYVPAYQREEWDAHADELGMSRSEFVRTMVQAGRRGFTGSERGADEADTRATDADRSLSEGDDDISSGTDTPGDLESTVLTTLSADEFLSWDTLRDAVADDIEQRLEETLQSLQARDKIRYSGRNGGYTLES